MPVCTLRRRLCLRLWSSNPSTSTAEPPSDGGTTPPAASAEPSTLFEWPEANEEACATGRQCFRSRLKCDGGQPDCRDGSDETALACSKLQTREGEGKQEGKGAGKADTVSGGNDAGSGGGGSDTAIWGIIGAVVGVGACGILAYLYVNGCSRKIGEGKGDDDVKTYSRKFANPGFSSPGGADGELYGSAGPGQATTTYSNAGAEHSYAEMGAPGVDSSYANIVDGDDGGYALSPATAPPPRQAVGASTYDVDFSEPTSAPSMVGSRLQRRCFWGACLNPTRSPVARAC